MSDMRHVYNAYAAIYNPEIKKNLEESRDAFSKMNLNQLNDQDLYEVSEEILEKVFFHHNLDVPTAESLIEAILSDAIAGDKSPLRLDKIERLTEAFASAFDRIKEKSIRVAKESYTDYRYKKDQLSRLSNSTDLDLPKQRLHQSLVAEDRKTVKSGLLEIIEGKVNAGLQAYLDKKKGKKTDDKEENGNGKSSKGGKPDFLDLDKDGDKKESMKKAAKDKKLKEAMIVTNADKKGNTPAYQNYKKGMKNPKTGEPVYKAAAHMKEATHSKDIQGYADAYSDVQEMMGKSYGYQGGGMVKKDPKMKGKKPVVHSDKPDKLVSIKIKESGIFTEEELAKLNWLEFDEGYQRNPEADPQNKPYKEKSKKERMADPDRGINSPAFKKFMASQGM